MNGIAIHSIIKISFADRDKYNARQMYQNQENTEQHKFSFYPVIGV